MPNQVQIGPQIGNDGGSVNARGGNFGEQVVQQYNGKYAELWRRGVAFVASTPAQALLLPATTGGMPTIWNPTGSGKVVYLLRLAAAWLSGAMVAGSIIFALTQNTGSAIGTGAPIVTFTAGSLIGAPGASAGGVLFSPTTNTFTAAPTIVGCTGFNMAGTQPTGLYEQDYDAAFAVYPGQALSLGYSVATSTALMYTTALVAILPYYNTNLGE